MDLEKFIEKTPYLYHLTSQGNAVNIIEKKQLYSANQLITLTRDEEIQNIKREKRKEHLIITVDGIEISIRDQQPISPVALPKCLTQGWTMADFLYHLNDRVFMWPTLKRLWSHFNRYVSENPVIFRFSTRDIIENNVHVKFCRLNSGATRANSHLGGKAPDRGENTFVSAEQFDRSPGKVAEVTFEHQCLISGPFSYSDRPDGYFQVIQ